MKGTLLLIAALALLVSAAPSETTSFQDVQLIPSGPEPSAVAAADFNGDGRIDLASANSGADTVSIMYGKARGGFTAPQEFKALPSPHMLAVGDANGDRRPDLFVSSHDSNDVAVLLTNGSALKRRIVTAFKGTKGHNHGLAVADANGDGKVDLSVGHQDLNRITVLFGDGRGGFKPATSLATGASPYPHALADVNGDSLLDVIAPEVEANSLGVFLNSRGRGFTARHQIAMTIGRPFFVAAADLNGDRRNDLAVTHDDTSHISILVNNGSGGFRSAAGSPLETGARGWGIAVGDWNRDGKSDLAVAGGQSVQLFFGNGNATFTPAPPLGLSADAWQVVAADVNGDKRADLILPAGSRNAVQLLLAR